MNAVLIAGQQALSACKDKDSQPPGPRLRRVMSVEGGKFPDVFAFPINLACNHCAAPACVPTCPTGALKKREKDGIVDIDSTLCIGCRRCEAACPYGAPQFDPASQLVFKCNLCVDEIDAGCKPYCVMACMMRALDVGPIDALRAGSIPTKARTADDWVVNKMPHFADLPTPSHRLSLCRTARRSRTNKPAATTAAPAWGGASLRRNAAHVDDRRL